MTDCADPSQVRSPMARIAELQASPRIVDALRAGARVVLTGGGLSARTPDAALAACSSASTLTLRFRPPPPQPSELQEKIGAALGIAGGWEMAPLAMAARLLFAEPRRTLILAIDDAHTLSDRSLAYLAEMTELLAPDGPVLQIVLAAEPALLDRLQRPEFESLRNRLVRAQSETFRTSREDEGLLSGPEELSDSGGRAVDEAETRPSRVKPVELMGSVYRAARPAFHAAAGLVAMGSFAAIGYIALSAFSVNPAQVSDAPQETSAPEQDPARGEVSQFVAELDPTQSDQVLDPLTDELADAVSGGSVDLARASLERFDNLGARLSSDLELLVVTPERAPARAWPTTPDVVALASPGVALDQDVGRAAPAGEAPSAPRGPSAESAPRLSTLAPGGAVSNEPRSDGAGGQARFHRLSRPVRAASDAAEGSRSLPAHPGRSASPPFRSDGLTSALDSLVRRIERAFHDQHASNPRIKSGGKQSRSSYPQVASAFHFR